MKEGKHSKGGQNLKPSSPRPVKAPKGQKAVETDIDEILDWMGEFMEEPLYPSDMKEAVIGYVERFGMSPVVLLDREKCIEILMQDGIETREDAEEYFEFNTIGGWVGDGTPAFATLNKDILKRL